MEAPTHDEWTERLATLFAEQPAWVAAAKHLRYDATSTVFFRHREGEAWRLETHERRTCLLPGAALDPDFVFRFSPASIEVLEAVQGGIGEFAVALFEQITEGEVDLRIRAGFGRLTMRGYVKLLLAAGPPVLAFGATHGIRTLGALRKFIAELRSRGAADWEG